MHILFLQGTASRYMERVGTALMARGHRVARINLHCGERLLWRLPAEDYRGAFADWRAFIARFLDGHDFTHVFLFGDRRPYHRVAMEEARARAIRVMCCDLGYLRPDWLTIERDGTGADSQLPRAPEVLHRLASDYPLPELGPRFRTPLWRVAMLEVLYQGARLLLQPMYPHYQRHALYHPLVFGAGFTRRALLAPLERRRSRLELAQLRASAAPYWLLPLQLSTDFQIRAHSPYPHMQAVAAEVIASFAAHAPPAHRLLVKMHPLDCDVVGWRKLVAAIARGCGVGARVHYVHDGEIEPLIEQARGMVVVNSTSGFTALLRGRPVMALGNAFYRIGGLVHPGDLASFWRAPVAPDRGLAEALLRVAVGRTQIRGGLHTPESLAVAVAETVRRLEEEEPSGAGHQSP